MAYGMKDQFWQQKMSSQLTTQLQKITHDVQGLLSIIIIITAALWFLSIFFYSSPNLSGRRLDVYHTSTHDVALLRI